MVALRSLGALRSISDFSSGLTVSAKADAARQLLASASGVDEGFTAASRIFEDSIDNARRFARLHLEVEEALTIRPKTRDDIVHGYMLATNAVQLFRKPKNGEATQAFNDALASARTRIAGLPKKYSTRSAEPPEVVAPVLRTSETVTRETTEIAKVVNDLTLQRGWLSGRLLVTQPSRDALDQFMQSIRVAQLQREGIDIQWVRTVQHVDQNAFVAQLDFSLDPHKIGRPLKNAVERRLDAEVRSLLKRVANANSPYGPLYVELGSSADGPHYSKFIYSQVAPRMAKHGVTLRYRALSQSESGFQAVLQFKRE